MNDTILRQSINMRSPDQASPLYPTEVVPEWARGSGYYAEGARGSRGPDPSTLPSRRVVEALLAKAYGIESPLPYKGLRGGYPIKDSDKTIE
jgi:hypothetical protein